MQFTDTSAGRVRYQVRGEGPVLFLMHGNGHSHHEWDAVVELLGRDHTLIAWDMPGQGDSVPLVRHLSIADYATAAVEVLEDLDVEGAVLVGSSVGGCIAAAVGAAGCPRVRGLVLVETNFRAEAWWDEHWDFIESLFAVPTQSFDQVAPRYRHLTQEVWQRHVTDRNKAGGPAMFSVMWAIREFDIEAAARATTLPTLLVFGADGPTADARPEFSAAMPHASVAVLERSGHFPMVDEPESLARHLRRFAGEVGGPAS